QVSATEIPKFSVMSLENSPEMSISRAEGSSPFLNADTVGSDSSSATHGSSTFSVAGKNRPPRSNGRVRPRRRPKAGPRRRQGSAAKDPGADLSRLAVVRKSRSSAWPSPHVLHAGHALHVGLVR